MSTLNVSNITDGTTTVGTGYVVNGSAKVFCNIVYNSGNPTATSSLNISSLTDIGVGVTNTTYTSSMSSTAYAILIGGDDISYGNRNCYAQSAKTVSVSRVISIQGDTNTTTDNPHDMAVLGDLA